MCYSLYLVHQLIVKAVSQGAWNLGLQSAPVTLFVTVPLCFATSIVVGRSTYYGVERHFLNTEKTRPATIPVGVADPASKVA
jgi:peptidoglycan/LPS O-acetylase OafA/YrhL